MYFCRRMSRILAIDYGRKRTGIAVTDPMQIIANGLTTVPTHELMDFLLKYVAQEKVERIVVGHPKQMNNEDSENMKYIKPFVAQLKKETAGHAGGTGGRTVYFCAGTSGDA